MMFGHPFGATNNRAMTDARSSNRRNDGIKKEILGKDGGPAIPGMDLEFKRASTSFDHLVQQQRSLGNLPGSGSFKSSSPGSDSSQKSQKKLPAHEINTANRKDDFGGGSSDGSGDSAGKNQFPSLKHRARADFQQVLDQAQQTHDARDGNSANEQSSSSINKPQSRPQNDDNAAKVNQEPAKKKAPPIPATAVPMSFPQKLMKILDDERNAEIISWLPHGKAFLIFQKKRFEKEIMPTLFKQSKFTSFTRKLNRWGFQRVRKGPEAGAYYHKFFKRGQPRLSMQMCCQKMPNDKDEGPNFAEDDYLGDLSGVGGFSHLAMCGGLGATQQMSMERRLRAQRANMQSQMMADPTGSTMMDLMAKRQQQMQMLNSMNSGMGLGMGMGGMGMNMGMGMGMGLGGMGNMGGMMGDNLMDPMSMMRGASASDREDYDQMSSLMSPGAAASDASTSLTDSRQMMALQRQQQMLIMQQQQLQQQAQKLDNAYIGPDDEEDEQPNNAAAAAAGSPSGVNAYLAAQNAMMKRQMAELVRNQQKLKMLQEATKKAKAEAMGAQKDLYGARPANQSMGSTDFDAMPGMSTERSIAQQTAMLQQQQQQLMQMQSQFAASTGGREEMMRMGGMNMGGMGMAMGGMMDDEDIDMPQNLNMKQRQQWMRQKQQREAFEMARLEQMQMLQNQFGGSGGADSGNDESPMQGRRNKSSGSGNFSSRAA